MQEKRPNDSKQHLFTCSSSEGRSTDGWLVNYCSSPFWVFIKLRYENFQCSQQPHPDIWISSVLTVGNFDSELQFLPLRADLSIAAAIFTDHWVVLWRVDGLDGWDGEQKGPLIFFILRYIKHYTHIYLYTKEKLSGQISCGFIFWSSWRVAPTIFKITLLGRHFSKMSLKVDFLEKNNKDFPLK